MTGARLSDDGGPGPFWRDHSWWHRLGRASGALWISTALTFLGTVVAARALGPGEYGDVVLALAVTGLVATLIDITLEEGVVHHGFKLLREERHGELRPLLRAAFWVDLGVGVVVTGLLLAAAAPLADIASANGTLDTQLVMLAAIVPFGTTIDGTTGAVLMLSGRAELRAWCQAAGHIARVIAMIAAIAAGGGAMAVVGAYAIAAVVQTVVQAWLAWRLAWRTWDRIPATVSQRSWLRRLTSFGIHSSLATTVQAGERSIIPVVIGALAGSTAVGLYAVAILPLTAVSILTTPLRLLVFPEQAKLAAEGAVAHLRASVRGWMAAALAVGVPGGVAAWFAMPWLIDTLFGDDFGAAVTAARVMLIAAVLHLAAAWSKTLPAAVGRPQLRSALTAVFLAINVGVTAALAANHGALGGAIGNLAAISFLLTAWLVLIERVLSGVARTPTAGPAPATPAVAAAARPGPSAR
jgi:O-antigen/teichoic acid export membrane protein